MDNKEFTKNQMMKENGRKENERKNNKAGSNRNSFRENKKNRPRQAFAHKGMVYQSKEDNLIHDWNCPVLKNANLSEFEESREIPLLTGCICPKCGRGLLIKKYSEDKEEGRALTRFYGDAGVSTEFLCEIYEVYHIYPYVYNSALKLSYKEDNWKIEKKDNKFVIYFNEFGENMPGWFNDYWKEYGEVEGSQFEEAIKMILSKDIRS